MVLMDGKIDKKYVDMSKRFKMTLPTEMFFEK